MSRNRIRWTGWLTRVAAAAVLGLAACEGPGDPEPLEVRTILSTAIVSDPAAAAAGVSASAALEGPGTVEITYVSLPPGAIPNAEWVTIRNRRTGAVVEAAMLDGGLDPVPVKGSAGDTLDLDILVSSGVETLRYVLIVPARRPPIVVRTDPPPRKRDVPLNASMLIVFSEPIDPATLTGTAVQLLDGQTRVTGQALLTGATQLMASFVPDAPLREGTPYVLVIAQEIRDLDAEPLEAVVEVPFTTAGTGDGIPRGSWSLPLLPNSAVIQVGNSILFTTVVPDTGIKVFPDPAVTWSVSDTTIAVVTAGGVVTALRAGQTTVAASCPGRGDGTAELTVVEREGRVAVSDDYVWSYVLEGWGLAPVVDVWGSSATDVFAVGSSELWECCATIIHYDGAGWGYMPLPETVFALSGVWGSSPTDVFAVGAGFADGQWHHEQVILRYDGAVWSRMPTPPGGGLEAVWGHSATDVFAAGSGVILHYDGSSWTTVWEGLLGGDHWLPDIWGTSDGHVFVVGSGVLHSSDGINWSEMPTPPVGVLTGVWGSSSSDVFAVGGAGVIHYDGTAWSRMDAPKTDGALLGIWGNSGQDVFAVGDYGGWGAGCCAPLLHYDGTRWVVTGVSGGLPLNDVWTTPDRVFIVGTGPTIIEGIRKRDR